MMQQIYHSVHVLFIVFLAIQTDACIIKLDTDHVYLYDPRTCDDPTMLLAPYLQ